jgi:hypothetical protein
MQSTTTCRPQSWAWLFSSNQVLFPANDIFCRLLGLSRSEDAENPMLSIRAKEGRLKSIDAF